MKNRTVAFYQLNMSQSSSASDANGNPITRIKDMEAGEICKYFTEIHDQMRPTKDGKAASVTLPNGTNIIFEVLYFEHNMVFIRLGQPNGTSTSALRDERTFEMEPIPMKPSQKLELFTYLLIDFSTCIVSYMGNSGAPKINGLSSLFNDYYGEQGFTSALSAIVTNEILEALVSKDVLGTLTFKVSVPSDEVLANDIGIDVNSFDTLRNIKYREAEYKIASVRNRNLFETAPGFRNFINTLKTKYGNSLKHISVRAKNSGEKMQTYDLLEYHFTKKADMTDSDFFTPKDYYENIKGIYLMNRAELLRYIRI